MDGKLAGVEAWTPNHLRPLFSETYFLQPVSDITPLHEDACTYEATEPSLQRVIFLQSVCDEPDIESAYLLTLYIDVYNVYILLDIIIKRDDSYNYCYQHCIVIEFEICEEA